MLTPNEMYNQLTIFEKYCFVNIMEFPTLFKTRKDILKYIFIDSKIDLSKNNIYRYMRNYHGIDTLSGNNFYQLMYFFERKNNKETLNNLYDNIKMYFEINEYIEKKDNIKNFSLEEKILQKIEKVSNVKNNYENVIFDNIFELIKLDLKNDLSFLYEENKISKNDYDILTRKESQYIEFDKQIFSNEKLEKEKKDRLENYHSSMLKEGNNLFNYIFDMDESFIQARNEYFEYLIKYDNNIINDNIILEKLRVLNQEYIFNKKQFDKQFINKIIIRFHDNDFCNILNKTGKMLLENKVLKNFNTLIDSNNLENIISIKEKKEIILAFVNDIFPLVYKLENNITDLENKKFDYKKYLQISSIDYILFDNHFDDKKEFENIIKHGDNYESIIIDLKELTVTNI